MQIQTSRVNDVTILAFEGSLDTKTAKQGEDALNEATNGAGAKLVVDFEKLDYISSVGLRALLATTKKLKKSNGKMHLCGMNPTVKEVFVISGFSAIFTIVGTRAEALAAFK